MMTTSHLSRRRRADDRQEFFNGPPRHKRMRTDFERNQGACLECHFSLVFRGLI